MKGKSIRATITGTFMCTVLSIFQSHGQNPRPVPPSYPSTINKNFVRTWSATAPEKIPNTLLARPLRDVKQTTQYFDGLGRPLQTVMKQGSLTTGGTPVDMITMMEYDAFGRQKFEYLPTPSTATDATRNDGKFKFNPFAQQALFYNGTDPTKNPIANQAETFFYGQTNFEPSPLNRVQEVFAPGNSWVKTASQVSEANRRSVKTKYYGNSATDEVRIWSVINSVTGGTFGNYSTTSGPGGFYPAGSLYKNITVDEKNKQTIEFKDKEDRVILKKVQLTAADDNGTGSGHFGWLCTYYIYDDLDNLRCVIQPQGVETLATGNWSALTLATILPEQCFRYEYDHRNRMIMKKVPGSGEINMVYDKRDRLVMVQDANSKIVPARWIVTKYDELNRPVETGIWTNATAVATHRANALTTYPYPATPSSYELLSVTHYDDYGAIPSASGLDNSVDGSYTGYINSTFNTSPDYAQPVPVSSSAATKDKVTWIQTKVLGTTSTFLYCVNIYDDKGKLVQVKSKNNTSGIDIMTTQYSWAGESLIVVQKQVKAGTNPQTHVIVSKMTYDDLGRLLATKKTISSSINAVNVNKPEQTIVQNEYDALGQLRTKKLAPSYNNNTGLQTQTYDYNIRGWLLGVNRNSLSANGTSQNFFGFELGYDKLSNTANRNFLVGQFNGNIAGMIWKTNGDGIRRKYDFTYDAVDRILKGAYEQNDAGTTWSNATMNYALQMGSGTDPLTAYDANGNIRAMRQYGWRLGVPATMALDNMRYTYLANSNRLKSVTDFNNDPLTKLGDFKTNTTHPQSAAKTSLTASSTQVSFDAITDYDYDANGNLKLDNNKTISSINYNHLNLPSIITVTGKGTITYTYDADGNKLTKVVAETGQAPKTILYLGGAVYENDVLQFITHEEGRIRFKPAIPPIAASFQYDYMVKDHLGNVRMVLTEESQLDIYPVATLEGPIPNTTNTSTSLAFKEKDFYTIDNNFIVANPAGINTSPNTAYQNNNLGTNNNSNCNGNLCTTALSENVYRLNANTNKTGLGITLRVMAGDKVNVSGKSYHKLAAGTTYSFPIVALSLTDILNAFAGSGIMSSKGITGTQLNSYNPNPPNPASFFVGQPVQTTSIPQAFINYILFDEQFKYAGSGFVQVGSSGVLSSHMLTNIAVTKNGYIFVYCSNESKYDVFFDNLHVTHNRGPVLEETHYYPFGLTMAGISSKALAFGNPGNKKKFNDGSELASKEFSEGSGLELYETNYRSLDPQIGRFLQTDPMADFSFDFSPYAFGNNNPISLNDPFGLTSDSIVKPTPKPNPDDPTPGSKLAEEKTLRPVVVTASKKLSGGSYNGMPYSSIREESFAAYGYSSSLRKRIIPHDQIEQAFQKWIAELKTFSKVYGVGASLSGGSVLGIKSLKTYKDFFKKLIKEKKITVSNPAMLAVATIMGIRADQFGKQADALANILSSYGMMHAAEGTQGKGVYVITESSYVGSMGPSGGSESNDFYDVSSKKYIGGTYERY